MTLHLLRLVWNRKRQNLLLTLEIFLSFVVLFTVVYFAVLNYYYWRQPLGFVADRVWTIDLKYPDSGPSSRKSVSTPDTASRLHAGERIQRIHEALSVLPNIETIAASWPSTAYESGGWSSSLGDPTRAHSWMNFASDDYRDVLGINIVTGRWFSREDDAAAWRPIVINQRLAREMFGDADPLNQVLPSRTADGALTTLRIIGVIDDFRQGGEFGQPTNYTFYRLPMDGADDVLPSVLTIRVTPGTTAQFEETLVSALQPIAPDWTFEIGTLESRRENLVRQSLTPLALMAIITAFLLLMVALGLTGVVWQSVTRRIQEFGLRRAKGASVQNVRRQVLLELTLMTTLAVAVALVVLVQLPLLRNIPGMPQVPTPVFTASIALCVTVIYLLTLLCAWYPSRLATRIHPAEALHYE